MGNFFDEWNGDVCATAEVGAERLQSKVERFNLDIPMVLTEFTSLPEHAKKEYLVKLRKEFGGTTAGIADMFGCSVETVRGLYERSGASMRGGLRGRTQAEAWERFVGTARETGETDPSGPCGATSPVTSDRGGLDGGTDLRSTASPLDGFRVYMQETDPSGPCGATSPVTSDRGGLDGGADSSAAAQNDGEADKQCLPLQQKTGDGEEIGLPADRSDRPFGHDRSLRGSGGDGETAANPDGTARETGETDSSGPCGATSPVTSDRGGLAGEPERVVTRLRAFRVELTGPMDQIVLRMRDFAALVDGITVRVILSVDEEDAT